MKNPECVSDELETIWRSFKTQFPSLPYDKMSLFLLNLIHDFPEVAFITTDPRFASKQLIAINTSSVPPDLEISEIVGKLNSALALVKATCPDLDTQELFGTSITDTNSYILDWPQS